MFNCTDDVCKDSYTEVCRDGSVPVADKNGRAPNCVSEGGECDQFACNCTSKCKKLKKQTSLKWYVFSMNKSVMFFLKYGYFQLITSSSNYF